MTSLVIQTAFLGDVVLTTPLLEVLARQHGPLDVVTTPAAAPLLENHPAVRDVIRYDKRRDRGIVALAGLARRLRHNGYDAAFLPHRSLRSALLAWLARIPRRVGFHDGWPFLYTEIRWRAAAGHEIDRLCALAHGEPEGKLRPSLEITEYDRKGAERLLDAERIGTGFVALAPGSIWGSKQWPYFPALAQALARRGAAVIAVGSREEASLGDEVARAARAAGGSGASACGRLSLRESAALIGKAGVLVTNDSAPLHLAQAMGTPTVALFGPTVPAFGFGPRGPRDAALGVDDLRCRPCHAHGPRTCPLGHHRCMRELRVEQVLGALEASGAVRRRD